MTDSVTKRKQGVLASLLILIILIIDQWIKIEVKTTMSLHESHEVTSWFYIFFIENNGMAYGMTFINKYVLSIFRMVAIVAIAIYIYKVISRGARWIYVILLSMVLAGAAGNLIDCMFYGLCFTQSTSDMVSYAVPMGQGYAEFLTGRVVDMFYFPLIVTTYPDWVPMYGGQEFIFFSPVFNFADASISCSVIALLLFCRKELAEISVGKEASPDEKGEDANEKDEE